MIKNLINKSWFSCWLITFVACLALMITVIAIALSLAAFIEWNVAPYIAAYDCLGGREVRFLVGSCLVMSTVGVGIIKF